jgi:hypothetical protein
MTLLTEQLSAVRKSQWEAQLDVFRALGDRALNKAEQLIALNIKTSRATVEQAAGTFRQLLDARDPGELVAVGASAQGQWQQLFSYGSELLSIATGTRVAAWTIPLPALGANIPASVPQAAEQVAIASATSVSGEIATAAADTGKALADAAVDASQQAIARASGQPGKPATELESEKAGAAPSESPQDDNGDVTLEVTFTAAPGDSLAATAADAALDAAIADDAPPSRPKPIARALNKVAPRPPAAEHPIASSVPLEAGGHIDLPQVEPIDTVPPLHISAAPTVRSSKSSRSSRKK